MNNYNWAASSMNTCAYDDKSYWYRVLSLVASLHATQAHTLSWRLGKKKFLAWRLLQVSPVIPEIVWTKLKVSLKISHVEA